MRAHVEMGGHVEVGEHVGVQCVHTEASGEGRGLAWGSLVSTPLQKRSQ